MIFFRPKFIYYIRNLRAVSYGKWEFYEFFFEANFIFRRYDIEILCSLH